MPVDTFAPYTNGWVIELDTEHKKKNLETQETGTSHWTGFFQFSLLLFHPTGKPVAFQQFHNNYIKSHPDAHIEAMTSAFKKLRRTIKKYVPPEATSHQTSHCDEYAFTAALRKCGYDDLIDRFTWISFCKTLQLITTAEGQQGSSFDATAPVFVLDCKLAHLRMMADKIAGYMDMPDLSHLGFTAEHTDEAKRKSYGDMVVAWRIRLQLQEAVAAAGGLRKKAKRS